MKICAVCWWEARGKQRHNRDQWYSICPRCAKDELKTLPPEEMKSLYGVEWVNYIMFPTDEDKIELYLKQYEDIVERWNSEEIAKKMWTKFETMNGFRIITAVIKHTENTRKIIRDFIS